MPEAILLFGISEIYSSGVVRAKQTITDVRSPHFHAYPRIGDIHIADIPFKVPRSINDDRR
jgi:hypothetical protein